MSDAIPEPPEGLGVAGAALWTSITAEFELAAHEQRLLADAAKTADELDWLGQALAGAEVMTLGSMGQPVANPLLGEVRGHRRLLAGLLGDLHLPAVVPAPARRPLKVVSTGGFA